MIRPGVARGRDAGLTFFRTDYSEGGRWWGRHQKFPPSLFLARHTGLGSEDTPKSLRVYGSRQKEARFGGQIFSPPGVDFFPFFSKNYIMWSIHSSEPLTLTVSDQLPP